MLRFALCRPFQEFAALREGPLPARAHDPVSASYTLCVPALVTTARLFVARYDPLHIDLDDGIYQSQEDDLEPVRHIRFVKQFTAHGPLHTRNRTVIVVEATALEEFACTVASARTTDVG